MALDQEAFEHAMKVTKNNVDAHRGSSTPVILPYIRNNNWLIIGDRPDLDERATKTGLELMGLPGTTKGQVTYFFHRIGHNELRFPATEKQRQELESTVDNIWKWHKIDVTYS